MHSHQLAAVLGLTLLLQSAHSATAPNPDTARWWKHVEALASDANEGRNTGSAGYRRAEDYVIQQLTSIGLKPAGTDGYRQPVPMHAVTLDAAHSSLAILRAGAQIDLHWLRDVTVAVRPDLPSHLAGDMFFAGDPATLKPEDVRGKIVVALANPNVVRQTPPKIQGAVAVLFIDTMSGPEPPRWPAAYAVSYTLAGSPGLLPPSSPVIRVNPASAQIFFQDSPHSLDELRQLSQAATPLPNFPLAGQFRAQISLSQKDLTSDNIISILPGSDPAKRDEYVVLSAHLDGYGIGEPWGADRIYNGAFDDAAYVATLLDLAQSLKDSHTQLNRSLVFCIVTGEEKGLLGSKYFAAHPTVPAGQLVADLNLDQLRPIFPLQKLTILALNDSTLGKQAEEVAAGLGIKVQTDPEPERMLLMRSDHWSFMQIGVPALNFVFGYDKGTEDEATYRAWYAERYHSPADDLNQPWLPEAAAKFNRFYRELVTTVADAPQRPAWDPNSRYRPDRH